MSPIATNVATLDPLKWVGNLNGSVDRAIHPEHAENGTGDSYKQSEYDNAQELQGLSNLEVRKKLTEAVGELQEKASADGNNWLITQLDDFLRQALGTFPIAEEEAKSEAEVSS